MDDLLKNKLEKWLDGRVFNRPKTLLFNKKLAELKSHLDPNKVKEQFGVEVEQLSLTEIRRVILDNFYREVEEFTALRHEFKYSDRLLYYIFTAREQTEMCFKEQRNENSQLTIDLFHSLEEALWSELDRELGETSKEGEIRAFKPH